MMNGMHGMTVDEDTVPLFEALIDRVNAYRLAYVHFTEPFLPNQLDGVAGALTDVAGAFSRPVSNAVARQWRVRPNPGPAWLAEEAL